MKMNHITKLKVCKKNKVYYDESMRWTRTQLGRTGEELTQKALQKHGYTIEARNWRCGYGEVDLIARKDDEWFFVEVRTRHSAHISPEQGLTARKRDSMEKVARVYLGQHASSGDISWHISFAALVLQKSGEIERLTFYPDLYSEPETLL